MQALLQRLVDYYLEIGDDLAAETAVRRQLSLDNLQEAAHRQLMEILVRNGRPQEALSHYQSLRQLLQDELDITPEAETIALVEAIRAGDLAAKPLNTVGHNESKQPRRNLPHLLTSFIGREKELAEISHLIASHRLVMLTGVGGIGKTTLSIQVGHAVLETFPDGVWLVELASVIDETVVPQTVLYALGLREASERPLLAVLLEFLREKEGLLILDNCEHLIQATAQFVQSALQACPKLKILANSREILDIPGERPYYVPPLSMPEAQQLPTLERWQQYGALRLFVARALSVHPEFQVTEDNFAFLVQICQRLDGIPLALELAAARVKMLTTEQIASRLDHRFRLLTTGNRSALPRHQTLRAMVDWSWDLLPPDEQALLRRLSVFAGGMTLTAVTAVCADDDVNELNVLDLLTQLVNKSLVIAERNQETETRYRLLETIKQYGQERLVETDEASRFHQCHLDYFLHWGEQAEQKLCGPEQVDWLNQLELELDNLRKALSLAQKVDIEAGLRLSTALWKFWEARGYSREGEAWITQFLTQANDVNLPIKAKALGIQSDLLRKLSNFDLATTKAEECLELYRALADQEGIAFAINRLVAVLNYKKNERIFELLAESLSIYRAVGNQLGVAESLSLLADYESYIRNNFAKASEHLQESLSLYQQIGHLAGIGGDYGRLGWIATAQGEYEQARIWIEKDLALKERLGVGGGIWALSSLAGLNFRLGDYEQAQSQFEHCLVLSQQTGEKRAECWILVRLGYVFLRMGKLGRAWQTFMESQRNFGQAGEVGGVIFALEGIASLAVNREQAERAVQLLAWADMMRESFQNFRPPVEQADVDRDICYILEMIDEAEYADAYAVGKQLTTEDAIALAVEVGNGQVAV
jgi:predicted ATPase